MLVALEHYWRRYPDLRLSQLVVNLTGKTAPEVFYFEDADLLRELETRMNEERM